MHFYTWFSGFLAGVHNLQRVCFAVVRLLCINLTAWATSGGGWLQVTHPLWINCDFSGFGWALGLPDFGLYSVLYRIRPQAHFQVGTFHESWIWVSTTLFLEAVLCLFVFGNWVCLRLLNFRNSCISSLQNKSSGISICVWTGWRLMYFSTFFLLVCLVIKIYPSCFFFVIFIASTWTAASCN